MRRDWNLIRLLLLQIESGKAQVDLDKYTPEKQLYHSVLLIESGLAHGKIVPDETGEPIHTSIQRLTWSGHDFLDATRNESIWNKAIGIIGTSVESATADLLKEACKQLMAAGIEAAIRTTTRP